MATSKARSSSRTIESYFAPISKAVTGLPECSTANPILPVEISDIPPMRPRQSSDLPPSDDSESSSPPERISSPSLENHVSHSTLTDSDIVSIHRDREIRERNIHAGMSDAARVVTSQTEDRYTMEPEPAHVPTFWATRTWDHPEDVLSDAESELMKERESNITSKPVPLRDKRPAQARHSSSVQLVLSSLLFCTDGSDFETDFELF
jgi:hypothetical protein